MTSLATPSLEQRLLQTVKEEVEAKSVRDWPRESVELCIVLLQQIGERVANMRRKLEEALMKGVEARSFVRAGVPLLVAAEKEAVTLRELAEKFLSPTDATSARLVTALRALEEEEKAYHDLLAEALDRVSAPLPAMDWERLKREADADFAAGQFVTFTTPEEMVEGLTASD